MDQNIQNAMTSLGYGQYIAVALALVGLASTIAPIYPVNWPGAKILHWLALLKGNAAPAVPAGSPPGTVAVAVQPGQVVVSKESVSGSVATQTKVTALLMMVIFSGSMLSACTPQQLATTWADGQAVCKKLDGTVVAVASAAGPISVIGQSADFVVDVCAAVEAGATPTAQTPTVVTPVVVVPPTAQHASAAHPA